jgi:hypothetical protein
LSSVTNFFRRLFSFCQLPDLSADGNASPHTGASGHRTSARICRVHPPRCQVQLAWTKRRRGRHARI